MIGNNQKNQYSKEVDISKDDFVTKEFPPGKILEISNEIKNKEISLIEYEIKGNNNKLYDLKIFRNSNSISFHLKGKSLLDKIYKKESSLEEFYNINRFFRQYLSIEDLFNTLFINLQNSELSISEISENNNKIKLILLMEVRGIKEEIPFTLEQNQSESENLIFNLTEHIKEIELQKQSNESVIKEFSEIKEKLGKFNKYILQVIALILFFFLILIILQRPINPIKKEVKQLKNEIEDLKINNKEIINLKNESEIIKVNKNEIKNLKNEIENIKTNNKEIINLKKEIENLKIINKELKIKLEKYEIKSSIIDVRDIYFIEDEIEKIYKNKKIIKYELLFRASKDGFSASEFHRKCDGKTNIITFVKTRGNKRFGGFTKLAFNDPSRLNNIKDFTFSIDNKAIYNYEKDNYNNNYNYNYNNDNINNYKNNGPFFKGKYGFIICDISNRDYSKDYTYSYNNYNTPVMSSQKDVLAESSNFYVNDYEVFKIYFE